MSMITGCPACGTLFKVVPDQLKISDGWVRCGHCSEVFDATAQLQTAGSPAGAPPSTDTEPQALEAADAPAIAAAPAPAPNAQAPVAPAVAAPPEREDDPIPSGFAASVPPEPALRFRKDSLQDEPAYADEVDSVLSEARASRPPVDEDDEDPPRLDDPALDGVSFVEQGRRRVFWRRPLVRVVLALLVVVLAALLAGQVAVHDRDRLAAEHPEWRPWLQRLCEPLGCRLGPPRRIDAVVIDSSGFTRLRPETYRLSVTLKNQATQPVAIPALELTLTDGQDQPVLRRVLQPRDLGATTDVIAPSSEWSAAPAVAVAPALAGRVAGYRLLAFYP